MTTPESDSMSAAAVEPFRSSTPHVNHATRKARKERASIWPAMKRPPMIPRTSNVSRAMRSASSRLASLRSSSSSSSSSPFRKEPRWSRRAAAAPARPRTRRHQRLSRRAAGKPPFRLQRRNGASAPHRVS